TASATPFKPARDDGEEEKPEGAAEGDFDDDNMEGSLSLAAIEAELKPKVLETFDTVADSYKRLRRLQDQDIQFRLKSASLSPAQERKYKKLKDEIIAAVKSLRLNQARIDSLVEQLYDINKRLVGHEGRLMRLAESHGVGRRGARGRRRRLEPGSVGRSTRGRWRRRRRRTTRGSGSQGAWERLTVGADRRRHGLSAGTRIGLFQIDDVAQEDLSFVELVAPDDDGLERERALAQPGNHSLAAGLDTLGDRD